MVSRRFYCGVAEYLTDYGIPLKTAARYADRFTPRQIVELHQANIPPETANEQSPELKALDIIALLQPKG